jgi:hypothetical protein
MKINDFLAQLNASVSLSTEEDLEVVIEFEGDEIIDIQEVVFDTATRKVVLITESSSESPEDYF